MNSDAQGKKGCYAGFFSGQVTSVRAALSGRQAFTSFRFTSQGLSVQRLTHPTPGPLSKATSSLGAGGESSPGGGEGGRAEGLGFSPEQAPPGRAGAGQPQAPEERRCPLR